MPDDRPDEPEATQHLPAAAPQPDGWVIGGRYRVTGRIGSGGMADVLRAHDQSLDRDVAIKMFRTAAPADTAAGAERQRAELHALARLNHPNLITLYDGSLGGPSGERAYLVMELVEGPNLGDRIDRGPLPAEPEVRVIGAQIADALGYVHAQGMVHRDIKPANILLGAGTGSDEVRARLSDFGIVRLLGAERLTQADSTLGTASYLAPEQARGSAVGPAADVYALGLTLVEALTGVRSFDGPTPLEAVVARLDRDPEIPAGLSQPWPGLLAAMTSRDPASRPSAEQVARALRGSGTSAHAVPPPAVPPGVATASTTFIPPVVPASAAARPGTGAPPIVPPPAEPERRRNVGLIVGLVLALVLIGLGAAILIATTGGDDGGPATTTGPTQTTSTGRSSAPTTRRTSASSSQPQRTRTVTTTSRPETSSEQQPPTTSSRPETSSSSAPPTTSSRPSSSASTSQSSSSPAGQGEAVVPESSRSTQR